MNNITTKAFSVISRNEDIFKFTQLNGLHGVAIHNTKDLDDNWFNPNLVHSLGYINEESLSWQKIIPVTDAEKIEKILDATNYSSGDILSGEINFLHAKGFLVPMIYKSLLTEEKLVIAVKKMSDHSQIEHNLEHIFKREQLLETILDTINVGVIACDNKGKLTLFNKAAKKWHGLPPEDIPQTEFASHYNLYEPDGETLFRTEDIPLISMLHEGVIRKNEMIVKPKRGKERFMVINGARLYDERKKVDGAVIAMYDITERKQIENQLKISEEMFKGTFKHAADGMSITDATGKFLDINDSLCKMLGYSSDELKSMDFLDITHPDDIKDEIKKMKELLNSERDYIHKEKRYLHKNGREVPVILSVSVVKDAESNPKYMIGQMTDITELKSVQKELGKNLNVTIDQNNRLNNFAHIVSHNLRSHSGNIEMLLNIYTQEHPEAQEDEIIQMAFTASKKLKETIKDLNEMAFIDLSVAEKTVPINLKKSVDDTLGSVNALIKKSNLQVINSIPEELEVLSLPAYMESIILNFTTNAIKYRSPERESFLRFDAVRSDEFIKLTIADNGMGIDLEKYGEKLFGLYKTFHRNEEAKGIGLFITKNQIEAVGGKIEVESEVDKGTVFTIYFKFDKK